MNNEQVVGLIVASAQVWCGGNDCVTSDYGTRAMREAERRRKDRREWTREWTAVVWVKSPCDNNATETVSIDLKNVSSDSIVGVSCNSIERLYSYDRTT